MAKKVLLGVLLISAGVLVWSSWLGPNIAHSRAQDKQLTDLRAILEHAERFELFSVNPDVPYPEPWEAAEGKWVPPPPDQLIQGYRFYGKTEVSDTGARRRLASAIHVRTSNEEARCFSPRHAIRATGGGRHVEVMICFECYQARVYLDGQLHHFVPDGREEPFHDQLLTAAGVALAQKGK